MNTITWGHQCHCCHRPIHRGKPILICAVEKPELVGFSHSTCTRNKYRYGLFWTNPPYYLSSEQIAFLVQFFPRLYALAGWDKPNSDLRRCVASLLHGYPQSLNAPLKCLQEFLGEKRNMLQPYRGDLESDFLSFLGQVQRAAKENPLDVEIDLRKQ